MARFGLIGGSYQTQNPSATTEMTMNWYPEYMESLGAESNMTLCYTPGLNLFVDIGNTNGGILAQATINGRCFVVGNGALWEINSNGTATNRGSINTTGATTASIATGNFYVFVTCNNAAYAFKLATNAFTNVTSSLAQANPTLAFFIDGYYGVVFANSNEFQISALEDPTTWNGVDVAQVSVFSENITGLATAYREIWFFSNQHAQVYYNSGAANFPINIVPGAFIEQGMSSPTGWVLMDNSVHWVGTDSRGAGIAWRANGYTPTRISNTGVEYQWNTYPAGVSDAVCWTYQDRGHTFWVIYFPSGNATWVYDASTQLWHQRGYWNGTSWDAHLGKFHTYCFGQHLVGSRIDGKIYSMSSAYYTDNGTAIYRMRQSPKITTELEWSFHRQLVISMQLNAAPSGDANANISLTWQDDPFLTTQGPLTINCGSASSPVLRAVFRRLGRTRGRVYTITVSDSVPWNITEGYLIADPDMRPIQRLSKYFGEMT